MIHIRLTENGLGMRLAPLGRFGPTSGIFLTVHVRGFCCGFLMFFSVLCLLCLCVRLFICALWSPAGKVLTSWFSFVVYNANATFLCPIGAVLLSTQVIRLRKKRYIHSY